MVANSSIALHLGAHKTGTSLLQKYMRDRPSEMLRMRTVSVPRAVNRVLIGWGRAPRDHPERLRDAILTAARGVDRFPGRGGLSRTATALLGVPKLVVLSNENAMGRPFDKSGSSPLYPSAAACAQGLAKSVGDLHPRIVYYIRSQDEFLESYYLQTVHQGGTATFAEWLAQIDTSAISWLPVVEALADAFGEDRLVVHDFAEIRRGQNSYIASFLHSCEPSLSPTIDYEVLHNPSLSQRGLDLALAMNPLLRTAEERHQARLFLQEHFSNASGQRPHLLSDDEKARLHERYGSENRSILTRYGGSD